MNKTDLVDRISVDANISKAEASRAVESMIRSISYVLKCGDHVTLSGFGSFSVYQREMDAIRRLVLRSRLNLNVSQSSALA